MASPKLDAGGVLLRIVDPAPEPPPRDVGALCREGLAACEAAMTAIIQTPCESGEALAQLAIVNEALTAAVAELGEAAS